MTARCQVCDHSQRADIEREMVAGVPFRTMEGTWGIDHVALHRHRHNHLPEALLKAQEASQVAAADDLLAQITAMYDWAIGARDAAQQGNDTRTAIMANREARAAWELKAELGQQLERRGAVNITLAPAWVEIRSLVLTALDPYPEAKAALAAKLGELSDGRGG